MANAPHPDLCIMTPPHAKHRGNRYAGQDQVPGQSVHQTLVQLLPGAGQRPPGIKRPGRIGMAPRVTPLEHTQAQGDAQQDEGSNGKGIHRAQAFFQEWSGGSR
jgi:hypothetical protein